MFQRITIIAFALLCGMLFHQPALQAQSYFSYQTITRHTLYFVIAWENKVVLGTGYGYRNSDIKFNEVSFEFRAPAEDFFGGKNFEVTTGVHNRFLAKKQVIAGGAHLKLAKQTEGDKEAFKIGLAVTFLGGYQVMTSLSDGPSSVVGARATYTPTLYAKVKDSVGSTGYAFAEHHLEVGAHWDMIIKRSLGLSAQPTVANAWVKEEPLNFFDTPSWDPQGHFYFGPSFWRK